jgi:putative phosphoesterase
MKKILLLSDTHGFWDSKLDRFSDAVDEIWHAGDIGSLEILTILEQKNKKLRLISGNIDGAIFKKNAPTFQLFFEGNKKFLMIHITGKPLYYLPSVQQILQEEKPDFLITGHTHILRVIWDKKYNLLYINPGACGNEGIHQVKTALQFDIETKGDLKNLQIIEWSRGVEIIK